ncbi:hypothetical protein F4803DRAFT_541871 [Xylaria telfairii]|nr:hypothetical protein F4803DRAFT_541871 [Xylaria telfairii]
MKSKVIAGAPKWHVYRYPAPTGQHLFLGSIIKDPNEPVDSSLNFEQRAPSIEAKYLEHDIPIEKRNIEGVLATNTDLLLRLVPSGLLQNVQAALGGDAMASSQTTLDALNIRTTWFRPDKEFMERALENDEVKQYARQCLFSKSLYMIIGIATANKLEIEETLVKKTRGCGSVGANIQNIATTKAEVSREHSTLLTSGFHIGQDCDFAYRVREFVYSRRRGKAKYKRDYNKGALFSDDADDSDIDSENEDVDETLKPVPRFEYFKD